MACPRSARHFIPRPATIGTWEERGQLFAHTSEWDRGAAAVAVGNGHTLVLKSDGSVFAWGANESGQLGSGTFTASRSVPVPVSGLGGVVAGYSQSLALRHTRHVSLLDLLPKEDRNLRDVFATWPGLRMGCMFAGLLFLRRHPSKLCRPNGTATPSAMECCAGTTFTIIR